MKYKTSQPGCFCWACSSFSESLESDDEEGLEDREDDVSLFSTGDSSKGNN